MRLGSKGHKLKTRHYHIRCQSRHYLHFSHLRTTHPACTELCPFHEIVLPLNCTCNFHTASDTPHILPPCACSKQTGLIWHRRTITFYNAECFGRLLKTYLFASYWCIQRVRGSWRLLRYINLLTYLLFVCTQDRTWANFVFTCLHGEGQMPRHQMASVVVIYRLWTVSDA